MSSFWRRGLSTMCHSNYTWSLLDHSVKKRTQVTKLSCSWLMIVTFVVHRECNSGMSLIVPYITWKFTAFYSNESPLLAMKTCLWHGLFCEMSSENCLRDCSLAVIYVWREETCSMVFQLYFKTANSYLWEHFIVVTLTEFAIEA